LETCKARGEWKLDIGCGRRKREGYLGIDCFRGAVADLLADPEKGLPFRDDTFCAVWLHHVFEHLGDPVRAMEEIWRVCRDGAKVEIWGPHFSTPFLVWGDPTHRRGLSLGTFRYFDGTWYGTSARFAVESCTLRKGNTSFRDKGWKVWCWPFIAANRFAEFVVNLSPGWASRYERRASRLIGFEEIGVVLVVRKGT
jgi:SAM-dependent methyltransferase